MKMILVILMILHSSLTFTVPFIKSICNDRRYVLKYQYPFYSLSNTYHNGIIQKALIVIPCRIYHVAMIKTSKRNKVHQHTRTKNICTNVTDSAALIKLGLGQHSWMSCISRGLGTQPL